MKKFQDAGIEGMYYDLKKKKKGNIYMLMILFCLFSKKLYF